MAFDTIVEQFITSKLTISLKTTPSNDFRPKSTALANLRASYLELANAPEPTYPSKSVDINLSVYRTPSGDFYCPTCNIALNSELQFKIHLRSKGHMKKSQQKQ